MRRAPHALRRLVPVALKTVLLAALLAVAAQMTATALAGPFVLSTDKLSYGGTVTAPDGNAYAIPTGVNGPRETLPNRRDGSIFITPSAAVLPGSGPVSDFAAYPDYTAFLTAWFYTTDPNNGVYSGWGNPNNTNTGFVQLYDDDSSTVTSSDGYWTPDLKTFSALVTGKNASYGDDYSRLWHAPNVGGAGELTKGTFLEYSLYYTAVFQDAALPDGIGWHYSDQHPLSVSGHFIGTFLNQSANDPSLNGIYSFNLTFSADSWAFNQGDSLNGPVSPSFFASPSIVPEPGTLALLGVALAGLGLARRRRS